VDRRLLDGLLEAVSVHLPLGHVPGLGIEERSLGFPNPWLFIDVGTGLPHVGFPDGAVFDASGLFPPNFAGLFAEGAARGQWVSASEGPAFLPEDGARYVALSPDGTEIVGRLFDSVFGLIPPGFVPPKEPSPNLASLLTESSDGLTPPARDGALVVLSSRRGQLWLLGGTLASGEPATDLWRYDLTNDAWHPLRLPHSRRLRSPLAATYDPTRRTLWVLDATGEGRGAARLLRVDPNGLDASVEGAWPTVARHTVHAMAVHDSGSLFVIASGSSRRRGDTHTIMRFDETAGGLRPAGFAVGDGALVSSQAWADRPGVTFLIDQTGVPTPVGVTPDDMRNPGRGDLHRWF
jgi:hypothetical protein